MQISEIESLWEADCEIDSIRISEGNSVIPKLHSKYMKILNAERVRQVKLNIGYEEFLVDKREYYLGALSKEKLDKYGWIPFGRKILKSELDTYINSDKDINKLREAIETQIVKVKFLEEIIKNINQRNYMYKNMIDWEKFTNGAN